MIDAPGVGRRMPARSRFDLRAHFEAAARLGAFLVVTAFHPRGRGPIRRARASNAPAWWRPDSRSSMIGRERMALW